MKKILLFVSVLFLASVSGYSQCVPDTSITHNNPGLYPDTLPHAQVGTPYSTVIQIKVPTDTVISLNVTIDSVKITGVSGLPPGYNYLCNPANCVYPGGSNGCAVLQGPAPTLSQAGLTYQLYFYTTTYGHLTGFGTKVQQNDTVTRYRVVVDNPTGISALSTVKFDVSQNHPNPFNKASLIELNLPSSGLISVKVANILGSIVYTKSLWMAQGLNKISLSAKDFEPGIYFYTITTDKQSVTKRMIVDYE